MINNVPLTNAQKRKAHEDKQAAEEALYQQKQKAKNDKYWATQKAYSKKSGNNPVNNVTAAPVNPIVVGIEKVLSSNEKKQHKGKVKKPLNEAELIAEEVNRSRKIGLGGSLIKDRKKN